MNYIFDEKDSEYFSNYLLKLLTNIRLYEFKLYFLVLYFKNNYFVNKHVSFLESFKINTIKYECTEACRGNYYTKYRVFNDYKN